MFSEIFVLLMYLLVEIFYEFNRNIHLGVVAMKSCIVIALVTISYLKCS